MSELADAIRAALAVLAAADPAHQRFGAAAHGYALAAPLDDAALAAVEAQLGARLPDDVRELARTLAAGGAGPYYGWLPLPRAVELAYAAPPGRALPVAHVGCGYALVAIVDGDARGQLWLDARALGIVAPVRPSFAALYLEWLDRLAHNTLPDPLVPPGACALPNALGGYLGVCEQRLGLPPGTIAGEALRDALDQLGPGAIAIAAERSPLFPDGARVEPCLACATLLANLGLSLAVVAR